jgi:hypothetical protein
MGPKSCRMNEKSGPQSCLATRKTGPKYCHATGKTGSFSCLATRKTGSQSCHALDRRSLPRSCRVTGKTGSKSCHATRKTDPKSFNSNIKTGPPELPMQETERETHRVSVQPCRRTELQLKQKDRPSEFPCNQKDGVYRVNVDFQLEKQSLEVDAVRKTISQIHSPRPRRILPLPPGLPPR